MRGFRVELLARSWQQGGASWLKQVFLTVRGAGPWVWIIGFRASAADIQTAACHKTDLTLRSYRTFEEVDAATLRQIEAERTTFWWDTEAWLRKGWRMWVGLTGGEVALVGWTRDAEHARRFYFPVCSCGQVVWQVNTLPRFRGRGFFTSALAQMQQVLFEDGCEDLFITCADYNIASRRAIEKAGFKLIGHGRMRVKDQRMAWFPKFSREEV
jgi:RimJ/RimL family protein N-acetyltransferase